MVKADKARAVEDLLIRMAQGGQVRSKITEKQLIELLEQVNQQTKSETKIVVCLLPRVHCGIKVWKRSYSLNSNNEI